MKRCAKHRSVNGLEGLWRCASGGECHRNGYNKTKSHNSQIGLINTTNLRFFCEKTNLRSGLWRDRVKNGVKM
jgi:hypothetical protein